jgi:hypothetical protein
VSEAQQQWIEGKNGGRLRPGGTRGPNRTTVLVRQSIVAALRDKRGGSGAEFWVRLKTGSAEDRRCFATVAARVIPIEVQGGIAESLTVHIVKQFIADQHRIIDAQAERVSAEEPASMRVCEASSSHSASVSVAEEGER